jgi:HAD superfamily hydrolase (TIGR01509 family)
VTLRALLFDVDGTLADTEEAHRQAFNGAFARHGYNWRWDRDQYRELLKVTGGRERIAHFVRGLGLGAARERECLGEIGALHATKTVLYTHAVSSGDLPLRPGVKRLIDEARGAGLALGIVTTTSSANVVALLSATLGTDSARWFSTIVTGERVHAKKPAPEAYDIALAELGVAAADCVAFEDSENGLQASQAAAQGAGIATVITPCQWTEHQQFPGALFLLPHLGDPAQPLAAGDAQRLAQPWLSLTDLEEVLADAA